MLRVGLLNVGGALVRLAFTAISIPLLLRHMGAEPYGLWSWVLAVLGLAAFAEAAVATAVTVLVAGAEAGPARALDEALTSALLGGSILATAAALGVWLLAEPVAAAGAAVAGGVPHTARALQIGAAVVWVRGLQQVLVGVQQAFGRFRRVNILVTAQVAVTTTGLVLLAARRTGVPALVAWLAVSGAGFLAVHAAACLPLVRDRRPAWSSDRLGALFRYGAGAALVALATLLFAQGDRLVVGRVAGAATLGVYAALTSAAFQINSLTAIAVQPLLPLLAAGAASNHPGLARPVEQSVRIGFAIALGLGAGLAALAPLVAPVLLPGHDSAEATGALRDLGIVYGLYSVCAVGFYVLQGTGRFLTCASIVFASSLATLALITLGAREYGLRGAALGNAGYLLNVALHVVAMASLGIDARRWAGWVALPVTVFAVTLAVERLLPPSPWPRLALAAAVAVVLGGWLVRIQRTPGGARGPVAALRALAKSGERAYIEAGRPLLPLTRRLRGPLRWYFHRSNLLRHDVDGSWAARLLPHLHDVLVGELPADLTIHGGRLRLRSTRSVVSVHAYYVGEFEWHLSRFLVERVRPGLVMVDVGAHHGAHALTVAFELAARGLSGRVEAFEPDPGNCALLRDNVARNELSALVTVHQAAVTDREGEEVLLVCAADNSSNTLLADRSQSLAPDQEVVPVPVRSVTLDGVLGDAPRIDLIKIDVQGAEPRVLRGAAGLIARHRPVMVVEAVPGWRSTDEVREILQGHGYSIVGLDDQGRTCPLDSPRAFVSWDWVALPS